MISNRKIMTVANMGECTFTMALTVIIPIRSMIYEYICPLASQGSLGHFVWLASGLGRTKRGHGLCLFWSRFSAKVTFHGLRCSWGLVFVHETKGQMRGYGCPLDRDA